MSESIHQASIDEIAAELKSNGSMIGSNVAYDALQTLVSHLVRLGWDLQSPAGFNDDITQAPVPGWPEGEGRGAKGLRT